PFSILLRGCSFLMVYETGVVAALQEWAPDILKSASRIYGASSGAVVAAVVLCECDMGKDDALHLMKCYTKASCAFLPISQKKKCWDVFRIANDSISSGSPCPDTSVFPSRPQAVTCSCFIPLYFGFFPPAFCGVRYADGELSMWQNNFVSRATITISAFAGEYNICPKENPAAFFAVQVFNYILQISKRNICRLQYAF
ncbi:PLPL1 protein, partial [Columbina picui]|nr:PLPL1 protein [Columbina picui]